MSGENLFEDAIPADVGLAGQFVLFQDAEGFVWHVVKTGLESEMVSPYVTHEAICGSRGMCPALSAPDGYTVCPVCEAG